MARGRKTKLTNDVLEKIRQYISADNYLDTACWAAGITPTTGYNWLRRGEALLELIEKGSVEKPYKHNDYQYYLFALMVRKAESEAEVADIAYIKSGRENWQSRAWLRERRSRERWGKSERHEITGKDGNDIEINLDAKGKLISLISRLATRSGEKEASQ
jgi:hypothetical protein